MAASSKFDLSSGSPDRPLYTSGQRGSHTATSLDRSVSFRENIENSILSSLPSMARSLTITQGEVINFLQCLRFDPKQMVVDHKFNRQGEFKRLASSAFGASPDDPSSGTSKNKVLFSPPPDELKRLKAGLRESSIKGRERVKIFNEALSVVNKCFPSIPSRKRSRSDVLSGDRSNAFFASDRSNAGTAAGKMVAQGHAMATGFELEQQKSEERGKNAAPSKRTRTSMVGAEMDIRANAPARPLGHVDRDRGMLRIPNSNAVQGDDRSLAIGVDGWEKSKMKKKRSGIKPDVVSSTIATKPIDSYREPKQGMQSRLLTDARSRINDPHGFRPGVANGVVGVGKVDGSMQQAVLGTRPSIPRVDQDNGSLGDKRDRLAGAEKERVTARVNKASAREDFSSASPTSSTKPSATARAPRSGSSAVPKFSSVVQRATVAIDWELSHCTTKVPGAVGANCRKRTPSRQSSSPPANWAGKRPQKISRTARRTNFVPIVSSNDDDNSALDTVSDVTGTENGTGFAKHIIENSPQQVKLKGDHFSSAALSESEESGAAEIKSRDKSNKADELDEKAGQNVQKISTSVLSTRKNKVGGGEHLGDGIRRQGRTGRGFTSTRSLMPMAVEKLENVGSAKQLRSARLGFDKAERAGRPPSRKLSDRKAYGRQKHYTVNVAADFLVGSDDGHEELLAAAKAVINPAKTLPSPFWRQMESLFGFISGADIAYLKQQGSLGSTVAAPTTEPLDVDDFNRVHYNFGSIEPVRDGSELKGVEHGPEQLATGTGSASEITLCQRLLAALISEENEGFSCKGDEDLNFDAYEPEFELDIDPKTGTFNHQSLQSYELAGCSTPNGYRITSGQRSFDEPEHMPENDSSHIALAASGIISSFDHSLNGLRLDQAMMPGVASSDHQYNEMSINERLLLEIHSVGIHPEPMPDLSLAGNEEISGDIRRLEDKYREQASKKKGLLGKLLKSASDAKALQEKDFELHALDKLVGMAYGKYMSCWGPNAFGGKSASSKMAKQAALAFVKRTLERCQEFDETGKSCFSEPLYRDIFLYGTSHCNVSQPVHGAGDGEFGKPYAAASSGSMEIKASAFLGTQQSPSLNNPDICSSDAFLSVSHSSQLTPGKEDVLSSRVKKRELLLDDVGGGTGIGNTFSCSAKGKRSERDREGKGNNREASSRNGTTKIGRSVSGNVKGERKPKTKPKQKITQLSVSVNGLLGKMSEQPKSTSPSMPKSTEGGTHGSGKQKDELSLDVLDEPVALDLSNLQIPEMDVLGPDDLGGQGQDIGSWLNIEDDGLQDHDFMGGLEIPMDDLSFLT